MPAVRTVKARHSGEDAFQLTWTAPIPPDAADEPQMSFSFAPNITPGTYIAPPPSEDEEIPSEESSLFPEPVDASSDFVPTPTTASKRQRRSLKTSDAGSSPITTADGSASHIPRPPNAFILFRSSFIRSQHVSAQIEGNHGTLSKIVGMVWHSLPFREREVWQAKARKALAEHKRKYPGYSFRPAKEKVKGAANGRGSSSHSGGEPSGRDQDSKHEGTTSPTTQKRKQREVGPRDVARCERIAALLSKGLKGKALEDAIAEFDASRAPVVITPRFEAPITAQQFEDNTKSVSAKQEDIGDDHLSLRKYRRSSSVPLLEADHSKASQFMRSSLLDSPFPTTPAYSTPPRPQSSAVSASPPTPIAAQLCPTNNDAIPNFRAQRKRSTSSSPPLRHRTLQPQFALCPASDLYQQPPSLSLATAMSPSQMRTYQASQPLSAPVLARQSSPFMYGQDGDVFFDYDSTNPVQWYSSSSAMPDSSMGEYNPEIGGETWEFGNFNFATASSPSSSSFKPSGECYSPFQQVPTPSSCTPQDSSVDPLMPVLVERPYGMEQHLPAPVPQQSLQIQTTNLNWADFASSHTQSPLDQYTSAHQLGGFPYDASSQSQSQSLTPYSTTDYDYGVGGTPTSPSASSECVSVRVHTPREGTDDIFASVNACNTSFAYNVTSADESSGTDSFYGDQSRQQLGPCSHPSIMPIDLNALNGALAPFLQV